MKIYIELNSSNDLKNILDSGIDLSRVTPCIGSYKGEVNSSYEIDLTGIHGFDLRDSFNVVMDLATRFQQESMLVVYTTGTPSAQLVYIDPLKDSINLGKWTTIPERDLSQHEAWTKINNVYMIAS